MADSPDIFDRILARPVVAVGRGRRMSIRRLIARAGDPTASDMSRREALRQAEIEFDGLRAAGWLVDRHGNVTRRP